MPVFHKMQVDECNDTTIDNTKTAVIKTKQFSFGAPDTKKRFTTIYISYKTDDEAADNLTVKCFLDGSASAAKTITFGASATVINTARLINLIGKTLEIQMESAGQDLIIDDAIVEYSVLGF